MAFQKPGVGCWPIACLRVRRCFRFSCAIFERAIATAPRAGFLLAGNFSRRKFVTYFAARAALRAKVPKAAAAGGPPASSHRLTLANIASTHYRFPR